MAAMCALLQEEGKITGRWLKNIYQQMEQPLVQHPEVFMRPNITDD